MGQYINAINGVELPRKGKAEILLRLPGAISIQAPEHWEEGLVCIVDNGKFDAAAYCPDQQMLARYSQYDGRPKEWLYIPGAKEMVE